MAIWYEKNISDIANAHLRDQDLPYTYTGALTLEQNAENWQKFFMEDEAPALPTAIAAMDFAFSQKYGGYDYARDLRSVNPDWIKPLNMAFSSLDFPLDKPQKIVAMGANSGQELDDIFGLQQANYKIDIVDISSVAIAKGKAENPSFNFRQGRMEKAPFLTKNYDLYLNLRTIQSSGADKVATVRESYRLLKENGLCVMSVANGYLMPDKKGVLQPVRGLLDNKKLDEDLPYNIASDVETSMRKTGFALEMHISGPTEIFVVGRKPKK
ncbi:MAG: Methyltransferase type 11 [Alphaproteobacteria bacterium]|nr:Methyltransferase type 11 [Alphaproteobacteria bacterium]